jgi:RHS repeat-associated protein
VRLTLDDNGTAYSGATYDPWGSPERGSVGTFGFTGELQQGDQLYLRARWYNAESGTFTSKDPFEGYPQQPYSLHPYQYGYSAPTTWTDPSGEVVATNDGFGGESDLDDNKKLFCVFRGGQWDEQKRICRERFRLPLPNNTIPPAFQQTPEKSDTDRLIDAIRGSEANTGVSSGRRGGNIGILVEAGLLVCLWATLNALDQVGSTTWPRQRDNQQLVTVYRFADRNIPGSLLPPLASQPANVIGQTLADIAKGGTIRDSIITTQVIQGAPYNSPFVSVLLDHVQGSLTDDEWLATIIWGQPGVTRQGERVQRAPDLGEFRVPADRLINPSAINPGLQQSAGETERLFLGFDLGSFLVRWMPNPYQGWPPGIPRLPGASSLHI